MNISSVILHARPGTAERLQDELQNLPGVEVHAISPEGKLIVSIESADDAGTSATFEAIGKLPQVLSASLIYHQFESDPDKEFSYESDAA